MKKEFIHSLELLRLCASILVAASHIPLTNQLFGNNIGGFSVLIFFMLSGFLLVYNEKDNPKQLLLKRWLRIAPLYYVFTVFTFIVATVKPSFFNTTQATWGNLLKSLLFIPYANPNGVVRPILDIGWALVPEIWFFLLYYVCRKYVFQYRFVVLSSAVTVGSIVARMVWGNHPIVMQYWTSGLYLVVGVALAVVYRRVILLDNQAAKKCGYATIGLIAFFCVSAILFGGRYLTLAEVVRDTLPIICLIVFLLGNAYMVKSRMTTELSKYSFALYLSHQFVVKGVDRLLYPMNQLNGLTVIVALLCVVIAVVVARFVYYWIELPMTRFVSSKLLN